LITAAGRADQVLLRLSNLNGHEIHTRPGPSIPMRVVAIDAKELKADNGTKAPLLYELGDTRRRHDGGT